ncbi:unnamed protein product [Leptidea sinapis]|uniref:Regulatory protein zeste n=1 Tax=Leptidea sinapis TaxID=189913 RepID=A0A5E4R057_9NEOP|nr:unnamed protein product [Leptidea sinapis]
MQSQKTKTPRKRFANFTAFEKGLLTQLIKRRPIVESKKTDGKTVTAKQVAWSLITKEFNCNANVQKRETMTLKKAWDYMKTVTRTYSVIRKPHTVGEKHNIKSESDGAISLELIGNKEKSNICASTSHDNLDAAVIKTTEEHLENKTNMEMQILKTQLEVEQIKKRAVLLEEERNKYLLEKAKIELEKIKKNKY